MLYISVIFDGVNNRCEKINIRINEINKAINPSKCIIERS